MLLNHACCSASFIQPEDRVLWWTDWVMDGAWGRDTAALFGPPRGAAGAPAPLQQISQLYSPTLTRNMPHDPYQAAFKVNIHTEHVLA